MLGPPLGLRRVIYLGTTSSWYGLLNLYPVMFPTLEILMQSRGIFLLSYKPFGFHVCINFRCVHLATLQHAEAGRLDLPLCVGDGIQAYTYTAWCSFPCPSRLSLSRTYAIKSSSVGSRTGLCLGHCCHCKPLSCKCKLGWSSQPPPDSRQHFRPCSSASEAVLTAQSDIRKLFVANEKIGVLLLNLGGPETLDDVQPFLFNLFADPVITVLICNYEPISLFTCCTFSFIFPTRLCWWIYRFSCKCSTFYHQIVMSTFELI